MRNQAKLRRTLIVSLYLLVLYYSFGQKPTFITSYKLWKIAKN